MFVSFEQLFFFWLIGLVMFCVFFSSSSSFYFFIFFFQCGYEQKSDFKSLLLQIHICILHMSSDSYLDSILTYTCSSVVSTIKYKEL